MTPENDAPTPTPVPEAPKAPSPLPTPPSVPVAKPAPKGSVQQQIAALPRYKHDLVGRGLVASHMVEAADGEWVCLADVLKLL